MTRPLDGYPLFFLKVQCITAITSQGPMHNRNTYLMIRDISQTHGINNMRSPGILACQKNKLMCSQIDQPPKTILLPNTLAPSLRHSVNTATGSCFFEPC